MRNTKNRKKILDLLSSRNQALSARDIHKNLSDIDLATVYRNLSKFVEQGIVRELRFSKEESVYEINEDGHEHAICSDCGKVKHIKLNKKKLIETLSLKDFDVKDIEINIRGKCK